uniref:NADH-ubiquinone oxidoreductase B17 subunit n=1 Tax=Panagrellus redivivus TaxID=6233 RepID=A0A7E4W4H0_PANRE
MGVERSAFFHIRKQIAVWIYPAIAGSLIFIDWNHTRQWKNGTRPSILDEIISAPSTEGPKKVCPSIMGTYTLSYSAKKLFERKRQLLLLPFVAYFGYCWDQAGVYKREMMKGHSRLFAERIAAIPKGEDPWKY